MVKEFLHVEAALERFASGEFLIVVDDPDRENEGDLIIAAEKMTLEKMSFLLRHTSGVVCAPMSGARLDQLNLPLMVAHNTESYRTAFTISVDANEGTTTGISASDRLTTVLKLANPKSQSSDFRRPGHLFPLRAKEGGVLKRAGHTEATCDLCTLSGLQPVGVLCEIVNPDGSMARMPELQQFAKRHQIALITIEELIAYRLQRERLVRRSATTSLPTAYGSFTTISYESLLDGTTHLALIKGEIQGREDLLVRVHSECLTGDIFGSRRCDCGQQLRGAMERIEQEGAGVIIYLRGQEGRGIGLVHKLRAYSLQDEGLDTVEANEKLGMPVDSREYGIGAQILVDLGVTSMRLLTNNPAKYSGLTGFGLKITERLPLQFPATRENLHYLRTKRAKLGHQLDPIELEENLHAHL